LLRKRCLRPSSRRRAAEKRNECAPLHLSSKKTLAMAKA
jgi:hypothetical protein